VRLIRVVIAAAAAVCFVFPSAMPAQRTSADVAAQKTAILHPADLAKVVPGSVFFRGQSATTQLRNSGGVRFANGYLMFATLVDNSGYSTGIQQKYQAYFITEVPLKIEGHRLAPGAYGAGVVNGGAGAALCDSGPRRARPFRGASEARRGAASSRSLAGDGGKQSGEVSAVFRAELCGV